MRRSTMLAMLAGAVALGAACGPSRTGGGDGGVGDAGDATGLDGQVDAGCPSGILCGAYNLCCEVGQECVNDFQCLPVCDNERCGDNLTECCEPGQACLDGVVCAAACQPGEDVCGVDLDLCCPANDVCLNSACVTPGLLCENNFDCLDEGFYCETTISRCLPLPTGPLCEGQPTFTDIEPELEWYWPGISYGGFYYQNILAAPVVGDVDGDGTPDVVVVVYHDSTYSNNNLIVVLNGAGDGLGGPEVLFTIPSAADAAAPMPYGLSAVALANFDADPGLEIVYNIVGGGVRIADNDGIGDVCDTTSYPGCSGVRYTGSGASGTIQGGPNVADLDHDGMPDVIIRCQALNGHAISDASLDFMDVPSCGADSAVADLDQDGRPEVVTANTAHTADPTVPGGVPFWTGANGLTSGYVAVADLLPSTPGPEVINVRSGFYVVDGQSGAVLVGNGGSLYSSSIPIPGGGTGGAPTVADFDGDGEMEVSTAGTAAYVVYDPDCTAPPLRGGLCASARTDFVLWETPTQDISSSITGSSVFDFQGDGAAEVLYNDECFFHIFDGTTGAELVNPVIPSSSRTSAEYPLVADVDGDGNAEMIVISNEDMARNRDNCDTSWKAAGVPIDWLCQFTTCAAGPACTGGVGGTCADVVNGSYLDSYQCDSAGICQLAGGTHGVRIYGDANDRWVGTRTVWNQFGFHVTNVELSGGVWSVPPNEAASWLSYNNYRQNVQGGALFPVPDLRLELQALALCPSQVRLAAVVNNEGSLGVVAGVDVAFYRTDPAAINPPELLGTLSTTQTILPGGWERLVLLYDVPAPDVEMTFSATTDPDAVIEECDEDDNTADSDPVICAGGPG